MLSCVLNCSSGTGQGTEKAALDSFWELKSFLSVLLQVRTPLLAC